MRQIWIQTKTQHKLYLDQVDGQINHILFERETDHQIGDILYGTVNQVDQRLKACFVDIGQEDIVYLPFSNIYNRKVKRGERLLVQIERLATPSKKMTVTSKIQFKDDALVYLPFESSVHVSHKLTEDTQQRLYELFSIRCEEGLIIRTKAQHLDDATLIEQFERLKEQFGHINRTTFNKGLVLRLEHPFITKLKQEPLHEVDRIIVDQEDIKQQLLSTLPQLSDRLSLNRRFFHHRPYSYQLLADQLTKRTMPLPSGALLTIDRTEALTAVDVDFGSYYSNQQVEPEYMVINREAVEQLATILKKRNIFGAIIVDLLNMQTNQEQQDIINTLKDSINDISAAIHVVGFTKLGMLELTRKREGINSYHFFGLDERTLSPSKDYYLQQLEEELCWYDEDKEVDCIHLEIELQYKSLMKSFVKQLHEEHEFHFHVYLSARKGLQSPYQLYKIGDVHWLLSRFENEALSIDKVF